MFLTACKMLSTFGSQETCIEAIFSIEWLNQLLIGRCVVVLTVRSQEAAYLESYPALLGYKNSFPYTIPCFQTRTETGVLITNVFTSHHTFLFTGKARVTASEPLTAMIKCIDTHDHVIMAQVFSAGVADFI